MATQQPIGGPDVTRRNKRSVLYTQGDEFTDGSIRQIKITGQHIRIEERIEGVWTLSSWKVSPQSIQMGEAGTVSMAGSILKTQDMAEPDTSQFAFIPSHMFNSNGSGFLKTQFVGKMIDVDIFPGPPTAQLTSDTIGLVIPAGNRRLLEVVTFEAGAISALDPVNFVIHVGTDNSGQKIYERGQPVSSFVQDLPIVIPVLSAVILEANTQYFIEMTSMGDPKTVFSVDLNVLGQVITNFEFHNAKLVGVVTDNWMVNADLNQIVNIDLKPVYAGSFL